MPNASFPDIIDPVSLDFNLRLRYNKAFTCTHIAVNEMKLEVGILKSKLGRDHGRDPECQTQGEAGPTDARKWDSSIFKSTQERGGCASQNDPNVWLVGWITNVFFRWMAE